MKLLTKIFEKNKKLRTWLHRVAVAYFIYMTVKKHIDNRAAKKEAA